MKETIVWSKDHCPYCSMAINLLETHKIKYELRKIGDGWTKEDLLEVVPNAKTVPQIFLHGDYVGGYDKLVQYFEDHDMFAGGRDIT